MSRHHPFLRIPLLLLALALLLPLSVHAQEPELTLSLRRDWGYGGFGGDIQGTFTFRVEGPDDLVSVDFFIDEQRVGTATEPPWRYQFQTDNYDLGVHKLYAVGHTASGEELNSNVLTREFVSARQGWQTALKIVVPIVGLSLLFGLVSFIIDRRRGKTRGSYGLSGGAVCPKCGYPFARHGWAPNLGLSKYDRCPHCGKWSMVRRASAAELAAAERLYFGEEEETGAVPDTANEDDLRKRLDDSRFEED